MADLCEICLSPLKHWEDSVDYDDPVICSNCTEEIMDVYEKEDNKLSFEEIVKRLALLNHGKPKSN